ncbi:aminodeoxychorismate synthase, component I [Vibrio sp. UCD-FRSSP16_10]|uniref:aminodeoxychorismate synthase component I n=1 Tax=unclassified Vibrio TaxID=2614977 RepID=UPI0008024581|nr:MULTISPECIES: aminodeoxychorismate synthase component I [unclassified Vibrio]OBT13163.1 aminodeoxychorismate synthase, component I [Vibrio sp. UCD-FRSSP16_30]OBT19564.1 aminodeoxychorismate synthase, component I [Vibrio sp. UCD-FRSSP16_10]
MSDLNIKTLALSYRKNLAIELFEQLEQRPYAMLLRSASNDHPNSRYDIVVANPILTVETFGNINEITIGDTVTKNSDDPFELLRTLQRQHLADAKNPQQLPFIGGWLGYFAYDLGRCIENIDSIAEHDLTAPDMAVGLYDKALIVDHQLKCAYWVGENLAALPTSLTINDQHASKQASSPFQLRSQWQANMTQDEYQTRFETVQDYLLSGDCYQINLAQRFSAQYQGSEWQAYQTLENANQAPFSAFIRLPQHTILSVSPERFLLCHDQQVETKPIKGTRPRFKDPILDQQQIDDLKDAQKDQAENLMIVDLLRNDIGRVSTPGTVKVPYLFEIESFPAVHHLVSTVTGELDARHDVYDLLRACFPGGSITGAPKVRAMQIIEELEPHRRSVYCGSIGYISRCQNMDTSITIRTLITEDQKIYAWAGGGLVADSECQLEYEETLHKLGKILPVLE